MESGNLAQKAVLPLLAELHQQRATGSLKLERAPLQKAVYFRDGQILFAASNDPKDQLASILVEEGKLGPDQMQVAQSRVSPGNPLAKVLTELGYISQRELAEAARLKVEKILTDIFGWKEGAYTFAERSLPKGAIDLELSTPRLLFNSIRRMPDRDWVLSELGSLDTVLSPTGILDSFLAESEPEDQAREVLRLVDGVKTIKQIGAVSNLGEFEVCKILTGAMLLGALQKEAAEPVPEPETYPATTGGEEVLFISDDEAAPEMPEVSEPLEPTILDRGDVSVGRKARTEDTSPPFIEAPRPAVRTSGGATNLLIDEPEHEPAAEVPLGRVPPRPRGRSRGAGGGNSKKILMTVAALVVLAAGGYAGYTFVWPMLMGSGGSPPTSTIPGPTQQPSVKGSVQEPPSGPTGTTGSTGQIPSGANPPSGPTASPGEPTQPAPTTTIGQAVSPPVQLPTPQPKTPLPTTTTSSPPTPAPPPKTPPSPPKPSPPPPSAAPGSSLSSSYELLKDGNVRGAAAGYLQHLRSAAPDKFTLAVGVYCDAANVMRAFANSGDSDQLIVLPYNYRGRSCYRVFWGLFDSPEAADRNFPTVPAAIRAPESTPVPTARLIR